MFAFDVQAGKGDDENFTGIYYSNKRVFSLKYRYDTVLLFCGMRGR